MKGAGVAGGSAVARAVSGERKEGVQNRISTWGWRVAVAVAVLVSGVALAGPANPVQQMALSELDQLMKNPANRHMVVAMASWCQPCREELPVLNALHQKYRDKGVSIVGVSLDAGGPEAMQPVVDKARVTFPVYWVGDEAVEKFDIYAVPMLFFVKDGRVVDKVPGKRSASYLEKKIEKLLK